MRPRAVVEADPEGEHFSFFNWHLGGYDRKQCDAGLQNYIPCNLGEIPDYYRRFIDPPDVMVIKTCPVDANGYFNFGAANLWHGAVASRAKVVIVEVDPAVPYVHGIDNGLHVSQVDYVIDGDGQPLPELPNAAPTDVDRAVARLIATEIEDGACLQIGIGAMPNAVCSLLLESGVRNLGIHTEMLTDGIIDLYRAGVVTGSAKTVHPGKIVCTFGLGSQPMYDAIDDNPDISCQPVEMTNLPHLIDAERPNDGDQQHDADGSPGPSGERVERSSPHQRHRRPAPVHSGRLRVERRKVVPLHVVDVRAARRTPEPRRPRPDAGQRRHRTPERHDVRRHRVRDGQPEGEVGPRAGEGDDLDRASRLPRRPRTRSPSERTHPSVVCVSLGR